MLDKNEKKLIKNDKSIILTEKEIHILDEFTKKNVRFRINKNHPKITTKNTDIIKQTLQKH